MRVILSRRPIKRGILNAKQICKEWYYNFFVLFIRPRT